MARRYVIVGAGVAGIAAAEAISRLDPAGEILLIGDEPHRFYSRPGLAYYLTGELPEKQLFLPQERQFRHKRSRVVAISPQAHRVTLNTGDHLPYDRLLVATGSQAVPLPIPGAELEGVVKLDNLDDARRILKLAKRTRQAVVIGGGITALEVVEGLRARGLKVHYLLRGNRYWRGVLDPTESRIVEQRLVEEGVELHHHTEPVRIVGKKGRVAGVETRSGKLLNCRLVAIAVGVHPRLELAQQAGLPVERGILVDEYLHTGVADIFAAGDVAQVFDPFSGRAVLDTLWPVARAQGHAAGQNMAGQQTAYQKTVPLNVTRLAGLTTAIIGAVGRGGDADAPGIVRGDSETWRQLPESSVAQTHFDVNRLRLVVGRRTLAGAVVMGNQALSRPLHQLIARQVDITPIRDRLLSPDASLADLLLEFWNTWRQTDGPA